MTPDEEALMWTAIIFIAGVVIAVIKYFFNKGF
jgi:hypothetical protein